MQAHLTTCIDCRATVAALEETIALLRRELVSSSLDAERVNANVARALARGTRSPAPRVRGGVWLLVAGLAVAAGTLGIVWMQQSSAPLARTERVDEFSARGTPVAPSAARDVEVRVLVDGQPIEGVREVDANARYRVAIATLSARSAYYLIVIAVDASREIHWIEPVYIDSAQPPSSTMLPAAREISLPTVLALDGAATGPLTVFALVSAHPVDGREVERLAPDARTAQGLAAAFPELDVRSWTVTVRDEP